MTLEAAALQQQQHHHHQQQQTTKRWSRSASPSALQQLQQQQPFFYLLAAWKQHKETKTRTGQAVAVASVGPIDRLRILQQTECVLQQQQQQHLQQQHPQRLQQQQQLAARGVRRLWVGAGCGAFGSLVACGVSLTVNQTLREPLAGDGSKLQKALYLSFCSFISLLCCYPFEVIRCLLTTGFRV
ncbi:hypothetical protein, conserved [Eimeria maxima]|uniref:Mitochondrial carrier domain-containing protein n=1 Tax=Eimeria maxima TaxID=5804 RepID=U6MCA0_EIMMA|nr:hypothetical protein, conserved [Eimeria maxima]CDJ60688.1 hypothetical protein, conserved [Eimeria maxima]